MIFVSRGGRIPDYLRTSGAPWLVMTLVTPLTPSYPGTMTWWNIGPVVFNINWYHDLVIISSTGPIEDYYNMTLKWYCQARVWSPKAKTKRTWADTKITLWQQTFSTGSKSKSGTNPSWTYWWSSYNCKRDHWNKNDVELEAGPVVDRIQPYLDEEPVKGNSSRKLLRRPGKKCPRQLDL